VNPLVQLSLLGITPSNDPNASGMPVLLIVMLVVMPLLGIMVIMLEILPVDS